MAIEFFVLGANHNTAPLDLRERISLTPEEQANLLNQLFSRRLAREVVVICTCNRIEIYGVAECAPSKDRLLELLGKVTKASALDSDMFYFRRGELAVEHLFRVSSSLDSQIMGETHILGQVKESYQRSLQLGAAGKWLNIFFQKSFQVAKRVRNETSITALPVSTGSCAVALANRVLENLEGRKLLVVGAGETGRTLARHFSKRGVKLMVSNRTRARADELAGELGGEVVDFDQWQSALMCTDIAAFATDSRDPLLNSETAARVVRARKHQPLLLLDLSVPRNVDPNVDGLESIFLFDIDSVQTLVDSNYTTRVNEAVRAQQIIAESAQALWKRTMGHGFAPFTGDTGRRYNLKNSGALDERHDPEKSTRAAARYLGDLYRLFGDWPLALAAYNAGEYRILRIIRETGIKDFWQMSTQRLLPQETTNYVPSVLAAIAIGKQRGR